MELSSDRSFSHWRYNRGKPNLECVAASRGRRRDPARFVVVVLARSFVGAWLGANELSL